jgi:GPI mannosyltransferase 2
MACSTLCHLFSVFSLYGLASTIFSEASQIKSTVPIAIAAFHIISPAGAFLVSPCSEALFSLLHILGFQLYLMGLRNHYQQKTTRADAQCLAAGAVFGLATTVRSNGLLSGAPFLYDAILTVVSLCHAKLSITNIRRLVVIGVGGCFVALGAIIPQYRAYMKYCPLASVYAKRPWCNNYVPSIYAWVQDHYWYKGPTIYVKSGS